MPPSAAIGVEALRDELAKRPPRPVYVVEGEEPLLADEAVRAIVDAALPAAGRDFNLGVFSGDDESGKQFLAEARSFPFLAERRVVLLRRFDRLFEKTLKDARYEAAFLEYLEDPAASTVLVLVATKLDRRTTLAKTLDRRARIVKAAPLKEPELQPWLRGHLASRKVQASQAACELLVALAGPALLDIRNEVDKLLARYPDVPQLEESHVEATVSRHRVEEVWAVTRAFRPDNAGGYMRALVRVLETTPEDELLRVLGALAWNVGTLLRIRLLLDRGVSAPGQIASRLNRNPYSIQQALPQAQAWSREQLLLWQRNLQRADVQLKSLALPHRWTLERALVNSFLGQEHA